MNPPLVRIRFDGNGRVYQPGDVLAGEYRLESVAPSEVRAIEVSVLWYTEGKGDEDMAVHDFWRWSAESGDLPSQRSGRFSTTLPNSPLSYRGMNLKLHWCVRVRAFLTRGREAKGELGFRLGDVRPARLIVCGERTWESVPEPELVEAEAV